MMMRFALILPVLLLSACATRSPETAVFDEIPGPPVALVNPIRAGDPAAPSQGIAEIELTTPRPIVSFWHDPQTRVNPWGSILLEHVDADGLVVIRIKDQVLRAMPGKSLPGIGVMVAASDPQAQSARLRVKWTYTEVPASAQSAPAPGPQDL